MLERCGMRACVTHISLKDLDPETNTRVLKLKLCEIGVQKCNHKSRAKKGFQKARTMQRSVKQIKERVRQVK